MRKHWDLDLVAFLRGDVATSPRLILSMIHHLPEDSNYVCRLRSAPVESTDDSPAGPPPPPDPFLEEKLWTEDRQLMAQLINAVNLLVKHTIHWNEPPKFPLVGPAAWRDESTNKPSKPLTVMDVINNVTGQNG